MDLPNQIDGFFRCVGPSKNHLLTNSGPVATVLQLWLSIGLSGTPSVQVLIAQSGPVDCSAGQESYAAIVGISGSLDGSYNGFHEVASTQWGKNVINIPRIYICIYIYVASNVVSNLEMINHPQFYQNSSGGLLLGFTASRSVAPIPQEWQSVKVAKSGKFQTFICRT